MRPIDADALLEKLDNVNPVDYGAMSSYEAHNGARDALSDAVMHVNDMPTLSLNTLRDAIYEDAVAHGLWNLPVELLTHTELNTEEKYLVYSAMLISSEVQELIEIMDKVDEHMKEELADVIIMSLSVAGKLDIDIDAAVRRKMSINKGRAFRHEGEK